MVNGNRGCIIYLLQDIFAYKRWKSLILPTVFWL